MSAVKEFKLILPKGKETLLREGDQLIVNDIHGNVITLVRPVVNDNMAVYKGMWKKEKMNKIFKNIKKSWQGFGKHSR